MNRAVLKGNRLLQSINRSQYNENIHLHSRLSG